MNDSPYGLTASIWTNVIANPGSEDVFLKIADALETGTVFLNRFVIHLLCIVTVLTKVRIQM